MTLTGQGMTEGRDSGSLAAAKRPNAKNPSCISQVGRDASMQMKSKDTGFQFSTHRMREQLVHPQYVIKRQAASEEQSNGPS